MPAFAVTTEHGTGWDPARGIREQDGWEAHAAFMDALVDDGLLRLGGPLGDGTHTLLIFEAADEAAIRERMAADPWAATDHLRVRSVEPWAIWLRPSGSATAWAASPPPASR